MGELWRRVLGSDEQEGEENIGGGRGEGMVGTPGKQGCCGEEALEGDGRGESPVLSAFIFSNKEKHIPLRLVWITCWLGADLQTEPQQEDATLGSGRTAWGGGNMAPARRVGGGEAKQVTEKREGSLHPAPEGRSHGCLFLYSFNKLCGASVLGQKLGGNCTQGTEM